MSGPDLTGKRVLILGAETEIGRAVTTAVAEAGASAAAVAATGDADAAFAVQRLARRLSYGERKVIAQAIDATNEAAVRVMVRHVSKELGGLDAVVCCETPLGEIPEELQRQPIDTERVFEWMNERKGMGSSESVLIAMKYAGRELDRAGGGPIVLVGSWLHQRIPPLPKWWSEPINPQGREIEDVVAEVVRAIAGEADSR